MPRIERRIAWEDRLARLHDPLGSHLGLPCEFPTIVPRSSVKHAKNPYRGSGFATPVLRGGSKSPLFVTAAGMDVAEAARHVEGMHGKHRIPTLLGWVDRLAAGDPPAWPT